MGYYLQAFIGKKASLNKLAANYDCAVIVYLKQGLSLIPMTEELFDQINILAASQKVEEFDYLDAFFYINASIEQQILGIVGNDEIAYIAAEYFGGEGGQQAIIWSNGIRQVTFDYGHRQINKVLRMLQVVAENFMDEFDSIGLGWHRNTRDWIEEQGS